MKFILATILNLFFCVSAFATAQQPDIIIYKNKEYFLHSNPLEQYFEKYPEKRPKGGIMSTGLWRGYIATFEIKNQQLLVKDIQIQYSDTSNKASFEIKQKSVMAEVFPDRLPIKVDWFTGLLVLPFGKLVNYVHMGYGSTYEKYFLLEIKAGDFIKAKELDYKSYEKFKDRQFEAYKKTAEYEKVKSSLRKEGRSEEFIDEFLRNFIIEYSSKILAN